MGGIYRMLGMEVGLLQAGMKPAQRVPAYKADVTYGTNSEFGFDYLRDNMVKRAIYRVQRGHEFAIVDEVDSILIDEARTPLIISGQGSRAADMYHKFARVVCHLKPEEDFIMDEGKRTIHTTESGLAKVESLLGIEDIYGDPTGRMANHLLQALRAEFLYHRDINYVVIQGQVKIVDEFTGRIMEGRRFSEGLHQALEAKERVTVREENQTLASITLQNYFRLYKKLSGMTGTAMTEDAEFREIYKLPVVAIPPNKPVIRVDENDQIYRTMNAKYNAVANEIAARHAAGQPCLVGTVSIENSERLSRLLDKRGIRHETLNAKNHERGAHIVAQAGRVGAVTIATNMAGRGTDILLGGNPEILADDVLIERGFNPALSPDAEVLPGRAPAPTQSDRDAALAVAKATCAGEHERVLAAGGLCVIGTERHESRRIDNQLRGRSGRQGDPGITQFYLSLEDDLMRLFGGDRMDSIANMMARSNISEDMPIQVGMVTKAIENAQRQVETLHFSARKNGLEYDDVMNLQRSAIYEERNSILDGKDMTERIESIASELAERIVSASCPEKSLRDEWDIRGMNQWVANMVGNSDFDVNDIDHDDNPGVVEDAICEALIAGWQVKQNILGHDIMKDLSGQVMLSIIDRKWMDHLQNMDYLQQGIGLRAYGQRDPLVEYKNEAYMAFKELTADMYEDFMRTILRLQINTQQEMAQPDDKTPLDGKVSYSSPEAALQQGSTIHAAASARSSAPAQPQNRVAKAKTYEKDKDDPYANVGRN
ncbi:MAG: preprotein translocase subunit SecA, partial [Eggerthellaceae bacterium]|nr:preprotein translocase subunit SecA [Eggerthellaceae bacterium]